MGRDKAFIEIDGLPVWKRQLRLLEELAPREIFLAAPARSAWDEAQCVVIADAAEDAGPLGGLVAALRRCSTPLLLALAIDLPRMRSNYLRALLTACTEIEGVVPRGQPLAAVYPVRALPLAESVLTLHSYSVQQFARRCLSHGLVRLENIAPHDEPLFLNMNSPEDVVAFSNA